MSHGFGVPGKGRCRSRLLPACLAGCGCSGRSGSRSDVRKKFPPLLVPLLLRRRRLRVSCPLSSIRRRRRQVGRCCVLAPRLRFWANESLAIAADERASVLKWSINAPPRGFFEAKESVGGGAEEQTCLGWAAGIAACGDGGWVWLVWPPEGRAAAAAAIITIIIRRRRQIVPQIET